MGSIPGGELRSCMLPHATKIIIIIIITIVWALEKVKDLWFHLMGYR